MATNDADRVILEAAARMDDRVVSETLVPSPIQMLENIARETRRIARETGRTPFPFDGDMADYTFDESAADPEAMAWHAEAEREYAAKVDAINAAESHLEIRNETNTYLVNQGLLWSVVPKGQPLSRRISSHCEWKSAEAAYYYHDRAHRDYQIGILNGSEEDYRYVER